MYYEEQVAEECYKRVKTVCDNLKEKYDYEIIYVNDGSKDKTLSILEKIASGTVAQVLSVPICNSACQRIILHPFVLCL